MSTAFVLVRLITTRTRVPGGQPRAEPVPHAVDVDARATGLTDVDVADDDLGGIRVRPRWLG